MYTLQDQVSLLIHLGDSLRRWLSPGQKDHTPCPDLSHRVDDLLGELLPALVRMTIGFVRPDRQTGVQQEDATVSPGRKQATVLGRWLKRRIVVLQGDVDVLERWRSRDWGPSGETQAMRLIDVMVWILTKDNRLDGVQRSMP